MTITSDFASLIARIEGNLSNMGVTASFDASTGLNGLVDEILNIEPSISGLDLDINCTLSASENTIAYGESVVLTAVLTGSYDDTSQSDVDLHGEISNATITFKKGNTILGTATTDNNGVATLTYTPVIADCDTTLAITAEFAGTDNFDSATSSTVYVNVTSYIALSASVSECSKGDTISLTAQLYSTDVSGKTITFNVYDDNDTLLDSTTGTTDSTGECIVSYYVKDTKLLYIRADYNSITSETVELYSYWYIDECTSNTGHWDETYKGNSSYSFSNNGITYNGNGEVNEPFIGLDINYPSDFEVEMEITDILYSPTDNYSAGVMCFGVEILSYARNNTTYVFKSRNWSTNVAKQGIIIQQGDIIKAVKQGNTVIYYINDTLINTLTVDTTYSQVGLISYGNRGITVKNLKIKQL